MKKEYLDSDRVNFLVWRYLLEGNYRETAAKFQKEWHIQEPHRHFDFAPHIQSHALVSVLNKGLLYHALERQYQDQVQAQLQSKSPAQAQAQVLHDATATATAEAVPQGIFGPLITQPPPKPVPAESPAPTAPGAAAENAALLTAGEDEDAEGEPDERAAEEMEISRKRPFVVDGQQHQQLGNGSPAKKPRLSNGYENGAGAAAGGGTGATQVDAATTPMEIDHAENNHAYPSPLERESAPTPVPRTEGPEQGTQVDKVEELATETVFLRLAAPEDAAAAAAAVSSSSRPGSRGNGGSNGINGIISSSENPIVLHCEWNPSNPSMLAAAGTDALARVWTISRAAAATAATAGAAVGADAAAIPANADGLVIGHVDGISPPFKDLIEDDLPRTSTVTAMAWSWDGHAIAVATESGSKARVTIWAADGTAVVRYDVQEPPVIKLKWNPKGPSLLGIAPDNRGTLVTVFSAVSCNTMSYYLPDHDLNTDPLDAAWISASEFMLCGGDLLVRLRITLQGINQVNLFKTNKEDNFSQIQFDWRSNLLATASEKDTIDLWDETGERRTISAHIGIITSLMWQPLQSDPVPDERLLASSGEDGAISIWNARHPESKPKCSMTMDLPVVALAFTPDGAFIAAATADRILIWKVGEHAIPRASWSKAPHPDWFSARLNGDKKVEGDEEDTYCLCWDATGQKLAYGANSRLAVINFR